MRRHHGLDAGAAVLLRVVRGSATGRCRAPRSGGQSGLPGLCATIIRRCREHGGTPESEPRRGNRSLHDQPSERHDAPANAVKSPATWVFLSLPVTRHDFD